jgi:hypothetical protein
VVCSQAGPDLIFTMLVAFFMAARIITGDIDQLFLYGVYVASDAAIDLAELDAGWYAVVHLYLQCQRLLQTTAILGC